MTDGVWSILDEIGNRAAASDTNIDGMLNAAMELVADVLPSAEPATLSEGSRAAAHALALLTSNSRIAVDRQSAEFQAGRLAAIVDILGYAAATTCASEDIDKARTEPYAGIIRILAGGGQQDGVIGGLTGLDAEELSEALAELHRIGMATSQMQGSQVYNVLTPVGVLMAEEAARVEVKPPAAWYTIREPVPPQRP